MENLKIKELEHVLIEKVEQLFRDMLMAATGVYWKPVWHVLSDAEFVLILANAAHVKNAALPQDRRQRRDLAGRLRA